MQLIYLNRLTNWRLTQCQAEHTNLAIRHQGIQQSSNPAILLHDIPFHLAINRCCLLICNSDFNFNKFLHQKICQRGFINFIGIQLVQEGLGTSWIWLGLG